MDITMENFFLRKCNPEYKKQIYTFRTKMMTRDFSCRGLTYCIIPLKDFFEAIAENQPDFLHMKIEEYYKEIVEEAVMERLENIGLINWWTSFCKRLYVSYSKKATQDFLYASASIGMWGFEETKSLYKIFKSEFEKNLEPSMLKARWAIEMPRIFGDKLKSVSIDDLYATHLQQIDAPVNRTMHADLHTYILSNALRRPILIFGYYNLSANNMQGTYLNVYLPLNHNPVECCKHPLILACYKGKYYPILQMDDSENNLEDLIPLVTPKGDIAEVCFLRDPNMDSPSSDYLSVKLSALETYMDVVLREGPTTTAGEKPLRYYCARIENIPQIRPFYYKTYQDYQMREMGIPEKKLKDYLKKKIEASESNIKNSPFTPKNKIK